MQVGRHRANNKICIIIVFHFSVCHFAVPVALSISLCVTMCACLLTGRKDSHVYLYHSGVSVKRFTCDTVGSLEKKFTSSEIRATLFFITSLLCMCFKAFAVVVVSCLKN